MKYLTNNDRNVLKVLHIFPRELSTLLENLNGIDTNEFKEKVPHVGGDVSVPPSAAPLGARVAEMA